MCCSGCRIMKVMKDPRNDTVIDGNLGELSL